MGALQFICGYQPLLCNVGYLHFRRRIFSQNRTNCHTLKTSTSSYFWIPVVPTWRPCQLERRYSLLCYLYVCYWI